MQQKIKSILNENQDFWQKLLGSALYANLLENLQCNMITVQAEMNITASICCLMKIMYINCAKNITR